MKDFRPDHLTFEILIHHPDIAKGKGLSRRNQFIRKKEGAGEEEDHNNKKDRVTV